jgi:hypothetical protein
MVCLRHLTGPDAGREIELRRFPFQIGRGPGDHLRLEAPGLWEGHCVIEPGDDRRLWVRARPGAPVQVNGVPVESAPLRNGDLLEAGGVRLRFGLGPVRQTGLRPREALTWIGLALAATFQLFVAWNLTR